MGGSGVTFGWDHAIKLGPVAWQRASGPGHFIPQNFTSVLARGRTSFDPTCFLGTCLEAFQAQSNSTSVVGL